MIQIRNVPDAVHRRLKARAALSGMSLTDFLLLELRKVLEKPTTDELRKRLDSQCRVKLESSVVEILSEARESR